MSTVASLSGRFIAFLETRPANPYPPETEAATAWQSWKDARNASRCLGEEVSERLRLATEARRKVNQRPDDRALAEEHSRLVAELEAAQLREREALYATATAVLTLHRVAVVYPPPLGFTM
jgi:hypothetical protein